MRFPFPNPRLSPNKRIDRRQLIADRQDAKEIGYWITKDAKLCLKPKQLQLRMVICPPDKRRRDDDNIYSSFKPYRDGIFQALELDDKLVRRTIIEWGEVISGGELLVEITEVS